MSEKKFPVNETKIAGLITGKFIDNPSKNRVSFSVRIDREKPVFINVVVSGEKRYQNFIKNYNEALETNKTSVNDKTFNNVYIKISGAAYFSKNEDKDLGITHQNFSLIAAGDLDAKTEKFWMPKGEAEIKEFKSLHKSNDQANAQLDIRAKIVTDVSIKQTKGNKEFATFGVNVLYIDKKTDEVKPMFTNVVIPTSNLNQLRTGNFEKGAMVLISGTPQPSSYVNANGKTVGTFSLISQNIAIDHTKSVSAKQAIEAIKDVAQEKNAKTRAAKAEKNIDGLSK